MKTNAKQREEGSSRAQVQCTERSSPPLVHAFLQPEEKLRTRLLTLDSDLKSSKHWQRKRSANREREGERETTVGVGLCQDQLDP